MALVLAAVRRLQKVAISTMAGQLSSELFTKAKMGSLNGLVGFVVMRSSRLPPKFSYRESGWGWHVCSAVR